MRTIVHICHRQHHSDLKPANIFVAHRPGEPPSLPRAKLGDFGLAVQEAREESQGGHASSVGSLTTAPSSGSGRHTSDIGTVTYQVDDLVMVACCDACFYEAVVAVEGVEGVCNDS